MNSSEALKEASRAAFANQFEVSKHGLERMAERGATRKDICCAMRSASLATEQEHERKWRLEGGKDLDGEPLTVVIVFTGTGLVVSVF